MKMFFLIFALMITALAQANTAFDTSRDKENGSLVYRGLITFDDLRKNPEFSWLDSAANAYKPERLSTNELAFECKNVRMLVFMGTWCSDSRRVIPQLYKVLTKIEYPLKDVMLYGMDREKTTGTGIEKTYGITLVPTIILYRDNKEVGRIIETLQTTMEGDLIKILSNY